MTVPEHTHPDIERSIAQRYTLLNAAIAQGFADMLQELRAGFGRHDERLDRVEARLDQIETALRRITPNGNQP